MKRTSPAVIAAWVVGGAVAGYVLQAGLALVGLARIQAPVTLAISLIALALVTVLFAVSVWRATHGRSHRPVDPIAAARTVVFAKAATVLGALLTGVALGFVGDLLMRPILADTQALVRSLAMLGASVVLVIAGLVAERLCMVPPSGGADDDDPARPAGPE